jgi:hypothetical protein
VLCYEVIYRHLLAAFHNLSTFQQFINLSAMNHSITAAYSSNNKKHTFHQQQLNQHLPTAA